jgi:hypothetical protein
MKDNKTIEIVFLKNESQTMIVFVSERHSQNMIISGRSLPEKNQDIQPENLAEDKAVPSA